VIRMTGEARKLSSAGRVGRSSLLVHAWLLALAGSVSLWAGDPAPVANGPLTITPFQTASFVADPEAARLLDGLAEFSTRLLVWADTPRAPVTTVGRVIKGAFLPFYDEWRGAHPTAPRLTSAVVIDRVGDGYLSLESPRIVRVTIGSELSVSAINPVGLVSIIYGYNPKQDCLS